MLFFAAMVQALRALQEKISSLESDRATAKEEIMRLSKETEGYTPTFVKQDTHCRDPLFSSTVPNSHGWLQTNLHECNNFVWSLMSLVDKLPWSSP